MTDIDVTDEESRKTAGARIDPPDTLEGSHVLAIETARDACSVAVIRSDGFAASATTLVPRSHAEHLVPMAVAVTDRAGLRFNEIGVVAVSAGPGSYTGLRIGVSVAKGFAMAHGASLVGVPTLEAYAHSVTHLSRLYGLTVERVAIALTARQSEIYFAVFGAATWPQMQTLLQPSVLEQSEAANVLDTALGEASTLVAGDAAADLAGLLRSRNVTEWSLTPSALSVGAVGIQRARKEQFDDVRLFEPQYLRDYVAGSSRSVFERLTL